MLSSLYCLNLSLKKNESLNQQLKKSCSYFPNGLPKVAINQVSSLALIYLKLTKLINIEAAMHNPQTQIGFVDIWI